MNYTRAEQETSIIWDDEEKVARIYTASPVSIRKLNRLCRSNPDEYKIVWAEMDGDRITAAKYETGCKLIRFGKPREVTEEQREAARERFARIRAEQPIN